MIARTLAVACGFAAAISMSQAPEYAQQYRQRLGGAVDELARVLAEFDADAARYGMSRDQGITRLIQNADVFVSDRGVRLREDSARLARLQRQLNDFQTAGPFVRIAVLARDADPAIAGRTWESFEPAAPVTMEGAVMAGAGFLTGFGIAQLLAWPMRRRRALRAQRRASL
jgi:hypothetical protein